MRWLVITLWLFLAGLPLNAQDRSDAEADKGFLTNFLESKLSGIGRTVTLNGFQGALSSRATFTELSIADAAGVWIRFTDGAISWNRGALLSGRVEIAELSATQIELLRKPSSGESQADYSSFSLPELPVSVSIGQLRADRVVLAPDILGQEAVVSIQGRADLAGGAGSTDFSLTRVDGKEGALTFSGSYANATGEATLDLLAKEGANGIAATLLDLPGKPAAELALHGSGTFADFRTDLALSTDKVPRVTGRLTTAAPQAASGSAGDRSFSLAVRGDISPLLPPDYADFFGTAVSLEADGTNRANGRIDLTRMVLESPGVGLNGSLSLSRERVPLAAALTVRLGLPDRRDLILPVPGGRTTVRSGSLFLRHDASLTNDWTLSGTLDGFAQPDLSVDQLVIDGKGRVLDLNAGSARIVGTTTFDATGVAFRDAALAQAIGPVLSGRTVFSWQQGDRLRLRKIAAKAGDLALSGDLALEVQGFDLALDGTLVLNAGDMARFSALAGRPLGGAAEIRLRGVALARSGTFDLGAEAFGTDLALDQPMIDRALAGRSRIRLDASRSRDGIELRALSVDMKALTATAEGRIGRTTTDVSAGVALSDLGILDPAFGGAVDLTATLAGPNGQRTLSLSGKGQNLAFASAPINGLFRGATSIDASAREEGGAIVLTSARLASAALSADLAQADQADTYRVEGQIDDTARLLPGFPGATRLAGGVVIEPTGYRIDLKAVGPGGISATASGTLSKNFSQADLRLQGSGQVGVLNNRIAPRSINGPVAFDLALSGPPALSSLAGRISSSGLRFASPADNLSLENLALSGNLDAGMIDLKGEADVRGGGEVDVSGTVGLSPPYDAALSARLRGVHLANPGLFQSDLDGELTLSGSLLSGAVIGGRVTLLNSEVTLSSGAFGPAPILPVTHLDDSAEVHATRRRADLGAKGRRDTVKSIYGLDLIVDSPARLFVRGLGLDAELGGSVHLRGTTANVEPTGRFNLIRGRLSLLGKRFNLDEGVVQLLGSMVPYVRFTALADSFGATTTILLEGPADKPEIHFTSSSDLPEEEVLSRLLFGRGLNNISAFQLAQLANTVATLTGSGGDGFATRLRKSVGLDDLDITADEDGNAALKAGKYISDQLYGEASVGADGKSKVELNFDLNADLSLQGTIGTDGQTGAGIIFSKDY